MSDGPTFQTTSTSYYEWPDHLRGIVAPLIVWEYCMSLRDRVSKLERELEVLRAGGSGE